MLLLACGPAQRGKVPDYRVGQWAVSWPPGATSCERDWLIETTQEHWAWYMAVRPARDPVPHMHIIWVRNVNALTAYHKAIQATGYRPVVRPGGPHGFVHKHYVYVLTGQKYEGEHLIRFAWHFRLGNKSEPLGDPAHTDPRWFDWAFDDSVLSWLIRMRRP